MHFESGLIAQSSVDTIDQCRERGGRIIAVGTTSARVLESAASDGVLKAWQGKTNLFIRPGHQFRSIDGLLTNFYLPGSTLIVLVHRPAVSRQTHPTPGFHVFLPRKPQSAGTASLSLLVAGLCLMVSESPSGDATGVGR